jgi:hypothetical protein
MCETVQDLRPETALELGAALLQQLPRDISQDVAMNWIRNKKALGKGLRELLMPPAETVVLVEKSPSLLKLLRTADVSDQEAFKAADFFKEKGQLDGIKFWLGDNFKTHFLKGMGKIELDVPAATLNVYKLKEASVDGPILAALGGTIAAKASLAYMAQLIKAQAKGQEGVLLTNGWANIFYVEDDNRELWAVNCNWYSGHGKWVLNASPVTDPCRWLAAAHIFSPAVLVP